MLRTDSEQPISALNTAVCQARTEETILEHVAKVLVSQHGRNRGRESLWWKADQDVERTTGTGAEDRDQHHGYNRSMGLLTRPGTESSSTGSPHSVPSKEGHTEVKCSSWMSGSAGMWPGLTQQKFADRRRPETWLGNAERDEHLTADADGVHTWHIARSVQRRPVQHRWNSQTVKDLVGTPWE